ncbi:MAG: energy-coupling factor transporter transmembrane protein EcfT [Clostridia bacterium]|nr:energy-coupling factor transporter transmembrane protein EcfT [Clostridia bacterium]
MLKDITLGQYYPVKSVIHRIDPRVKILLLIIYLVTIFMADNFISLGFIMLTILFTVFLSKVPFKVILKSIKAIIFIVIFTSLINIFFNSSGNVLIEFGIIKITDSGIATAIFVAIRVFMFVVISSLLTYTTTPTNLTDAIEKLLSPLKVIRVDVHSVAMMMTIALRFIPTLIEEVDKITNAQKARGADMESGGIGKRIKSVIPILIPLFISSFRSASDLAFAMECRCYTGGHGRTRMRQLRMTRTDIYAAIFMFVVIACMIVLNHFASFAKI